MSVQPTPSLLSFKDQSIQSIHRISVPLFQHLVYPPQHPYHGHPSTNQRSASLWHFCHQKGGGGSIWYPAFTSSRCIDASRISACSQPIHQTYGAGLTPAVLPTPTVDSRTGTAPPAVIPPTKPSNAPLLTLIDVSWVGEEAEAVAMTEEEV